MALAALSVSDVDLAAAAVSFRRKRATSLSVVPTFRGAALEAQSITQHEWMSAGPAETGKTFSLLWRLDTLMRETPRGRAAIVRKVQADMGGTVLQTWDRIIEKRGGVSKFGGNHVEFYEYSNGAKVFIGGMDRPGKVLSGERDFIYVNQAEEFAIDDWQTLATRSTGRGAVTSTPMLFGDCNPGPPTHWILGRPSLRVLHSKHRDNPTLYDDNGALTDQGRRTMSILNTLTGVRLLRLRDGVWAGAEGVVYENFSRELHLVDSFEIPADWRRFRAIDFGYTNPFVCQWWAADPDGRLFLYRELYRTQRLVEDHAREITRLSGDERFEFTVADHDAEDRATLARYGIDTVAAFKAVSVGIQAVQARLAPAGDGKPRLFVLRDALVERDTALEAKHKPGSTLEEFESYSWQKDASGKPMKEEPLKVDDHGMDAARYLVAYVDGISDGKGENWRVFIERELATKKVA